MSNAALIKETTRRIARYQKIVDANTIKYRDTTLFTFHGGWTHGYNEGKLSTLEDLLDDLNAIEGTKTMITSAEREAAFRKDFKALMLRHSPGIVECQGADVLDVTLFKVETEAGACIKEFSQFSIDLDE